MLLDWLHLLAFPYFSRRWFMTVDIQQSKRATMTSTLLRLSAWPLRLLLDLKCKSILLAVSRAYHESTGNVPLDKSWPPVPKGRMYHVLTPKRSR